MQEAHNHNVHQAGHDHGHGAPAVMKHQGNNHRNSGSSKHPHHHIHTITSYHVSKRTCASHQRRHLPKDKQHDVPPQTYNRPDLVLAVLPTVRAPCGTVATRTEVSPRNLPSHAIPAGRGAVAHVNALRDPREKTTHQTTEEEMEREIEQEEKQGQEPQHTRTHTFNPGASSEYNRSDRPPEALPRLAAGVAPRPPDAPDDPPPPDDADAPPAVARRRMPVGISPAADDWEGGGKNGGIRGHDVGNRGRQGVRQKAAEQGRDMAQRRGVRIMFKVATRGIRT